MYRQLFALVGGARSGGSSGGSSGGRLSQQQVFAMLRRSGLDAAELSEVWHAADGDGDGELGEQEFVAALELAEQRRKARHNAAARRAAEQCAGERAAGRGRAGYDRRARR